MQPKGPICAGPMAPPPTSGRSGHTTARQLETCRSASLNCLRASLCGPAASRSPDCAHHVLDQVLASLSSCLSSPARVLLPAKALLELCFCCLATANHISPTLSWAGETIALEHASHERQTLPQGRGFVRPRRRLQSLTRRGVPRGIQGPFHALLGAARR